MTHDTPSRGNLTGLDDATRGLVRLSAIITAGSEQDIRDALANTQAPPVWIEELVLQTYLFAGFPRALNAMREWRRRQPDALALETPGMADHWRTDGEVTCAAVYGNMYGRLRENIRDLHPLLDDWMVTEGYGRCCPARDSILPDASCASLPRVRRGNRIDSCIRICTAR